MTKIRDRVMRFLAKAGVNIMATNTDLYTMKTETPLKNRVWVALIKAAHMVATEAPATTNHAAREIWARRVLENPESALESMFNMILASNAGSDTSVILAATDEAIQLNVNEHIDFFAGSG